MDQLRAEFESLRRAYQVQSDEVFELRQQGQALDAATARLRASDERKRFLLEELKAINERLSCKFSYSCSFVSLLMSLCG